MNARPVMFFAIALAIAGSPAQAEIYRWVDQNGVVQYSDRKPLEEVTVETAKVRGPAPDEDAEPADADADEAAEEPETPEGPSVEEQIAQQEQIREQNCQQAQDNLRLLEGGYRLKDGATGNFLSDEDRANRLAQTQADIAENC